MQEIPMKSFAAVVILVTSSIFGATVQFSVDSSSPCSCDIIQPGSVQANLLTFKVMSDADVVVNYLEPYFSYQGGGQLLNNVMLYDGPTALAGLNGYGQFVWAGGTTILANSARVFVIRADYLGPEGGYVTPSIVGGMVWDSKDDKYLSFEYLVGIERTLGNPNAPGSVPEPGTAAMFIIGVGVLLLSRKR